MSRRSASPTGRSRGGRGLDLTSLPAHNLADLLPAPTRPPVLVDQPEASPRARSWIPRRGRRGAFGGRAANTAQAAVWRGSTAAVQGLYPMLTRAGVPPVGAYLGYDVITGAAFSCHPVEWLRQGLVRNPNLLVSGSPGAGKSATLKALSLRLTQFGVSTLVLGDLKGEYGALVDAVGGSVSELGPGLPGRLNPLDAGPLGTRLPRDPALLTERLAEIARRRLRLLVTLVGARTPVGPEDETVLAEALRIATGEHQAATTLADPTIPDIHRVLIEAPEHLVDAVRCTSRTEFVGLFRRVTDALGSMVRNLAGIFDAPTTVTLDFDAPMQSVDISRLSQRGEDAVVVGLSCLSSWGQAAIDEPGRLRMVIRDEVWRQLRAGVDFVRKIDSDLRLSRAEGTIQVLATHRLADFEAVGAAGSEAVAIARELVSSCDVRILLAQDTRPLADLADAVGLTDAERMLVASWGGGDRGRGLWKIAGLGGYPVQLVLTEAEAHLYHTDERMAT
ncbi:AAA-like domain-containing protein [Frankia sp. AiPs1]|uniref:hypothetical protein n=1 Tax=Frankia sp. AiPa1 TaxID=573492 RepID=UPI00202B7BA5|nr:hypothetical protein [Frankia sp. AiPa1]MCL9759072.1 hypothetical protein [Frankia sp. AiPa1]